MQRTVARIHLVICCIILGVIVFQFYSAGMGIFGAETFETHRIAGGILDPVVMLLLILTAVGRLGWRLFGLTALLMVLLIFQLVLPSLRDDLPWVSALHPLNALVLLGLTAFLIRTDRTRLKTEAANRRRGVPLHGGQRVTSPGPAPTSGTVR